MNKSFRSRLRIPFNKTSDLGIINRFKTSFLDSLYIGLIFLPFFSSYYTIEMKDESGIATSCRLIPSFCFEVKNARPSAYRIKIDWIPATYISSRNSDWIPGILLRLVDRRFNQLWFSHHYRVDRLKEGRLTELNLVWFLRPLRRLNWDLASFS